MSVASRLKSLSTRRNASWITKRVQLLVVFLSLLSTNTPGLSLTYSPHTPTVCLSIHLSISFLHFPFHSPCQSLSKSPSVRVCLSASVSLSVVWAGSLCKYLTQTTAFFHSHSVYFALHRHPRSSWCESMLTNGRHLQVYPWVWSLLAEPPSCDRSMTNPVRLARCYSRLDCIWKTMRRAVNELKKWPANLDQISWQPSISSFFMEVYGKKEWLLREE